MIPKTVEEWLVAIWFVLWMGLMLRLLFKDFREERARERSERE